MAKMTETQAVELLGAATALSAQLAALVPALVQNWQAVKDGLATDDMNALNDQIVGVHADVQSLDAQLQALKA